MDRDRAIDYRGFTILDTDAARATVDNFLRASQPGFVSRVLNRIFGA